MKLTWIADPPQPTSFPNGYWHALTDDGGYDGAGPDPLTAVSNLVAQMERHLARSPGGV